MLRSSKLKFVLLGILFALFWSSASTASKFGLKSVEPLFLFQCRFFVAGVLMISYAHFIEKSPIPSKSEFKKIAIFGFFNVTLYLSLFILGVNEVAAGIGSLSTSLNPLIITVLSSFYLGKKVSPKSFIVLLIGIIGCGIAVYPLLLNSYATPLGLLFLGSSMFSYSSAAIFYSKTHWKTTQTTINGWQIFLGGLFMLPLTFLMHKMPNTLNTNFFFSLVWLVCSVSILAVSLWLWLLKQDAVRASYFLFLCPIFGFMYAFILLNEPFTLYTFTGLVLVLIALYIGQKKSSTQTG